MLVIIVSIQCHAIPLLCQAASMQWQAFNNAISNICHAMSNSKNVISDICHALSDSKNAILNICNAVPVRNNVISNMNGKVSQ